VSAARGLSGIAQVGREALGETGQLLRLLRDDHDELGLRLQAPAAVATVVPGRPARTRTPHFRDCLVPALLGLVATVEIVANDHAPLGTLAAYWLIVVLLCARRTVPLAMPVGVAGILVGARLLGAETDEPSAVILVGALASFSTGRYAPRSRLPLGLASILAAIAVLLLEAAARNELSGDIVLVIALAVTPWLVGIALRETLERTESLAAAAERAQLEHELEAERAAAAERKRIARELHDVLATSLSVMTVQVSVAAELVREDPARAADAVAEVERAGRAALGETGRLLRLISEGSDDPGPRPQHRLADVTALAAEFSRAGLTIELQLNAGERLSPAIELSAYRIVQEGLTNALKHAPGSSVRVRVTRSPHELAVEIENDRPAANGRPTVPSGHGLAGLRERVALFSGSLTARPSAAGGFLLAATIPLGSGE
jgi:signal transduction histidine kinase